MLSCLYLRDIDGRYRSVILNQGLYSSTDGFFIVFSSSFGFCKDCGPEAGSIKAVQL